MTAQTLEPREDQSLMSKRIYSRRTDDELIAELESRIKKIEGRMESKQREDAPVVKEIPKIRRNLGKFSQLCLDHGRGDIANSILAFMATLDSQVRTVPTERSRSMVRS